MSAVPAPSVPADVGRRRVYVKDLPVRITHWTIFLCFVVLAVTGLDISHPYLLAPVGGGESFLTGTVRVIHFYTAVIFDLALFTRIAWMFTGSRYGRWDQFIPVTRERWRSAGESLKFYLFLRRTPPAAVGHDAFDGLIFALRFLVDFVIVATGFALYSTITSYNSPMAIFHVLVPVFGGEQGTRWLHHVMMWVAIAFIVQHVTRVVLLSVLKGDGTVDSMFSGYKYVSTAELGDEVHGPRS